MAAFADLGALFAPRCVAVIGASEDPRRIGGRVIRYLLQYGFAGRIVPVNPKYATVQGLPCVPSVSAVGEPIDLAILAVPAGAVLAALEACGRHGCAAAIVYAAGFAEVGEDALQQEATAVAAAHGIALLGPNSLGVISAPARLSATFASVLDRKAGLLEGGNAAFLSQSGAFGAYIYALAQDQGIGIRHFVSLGNEAGLTFADLLAHLATDPGTQVICGYVEGIKDGARFLEAANAATAAGKQVALLRVGRSERAQRAIASHTAALAGSDAAYDAAFERTGVTRLGHVQDVLDFMRLSEHRVTGSRPHRVAILTLSGGAGIWAADELARLGLAVADLEPATEARLRDILPTFAAAANPVDCTGQILESPETFGRCIDVLADDPGVDSVLLLMGLQEHNGAGLAVDIVAAASRTPKAVVVAWMAAPDAALEVLRGSELPLFEDFERAVRWLAAASSAAHGTDGERPAVAAAEAVPLPLAEHEAKRLLSGWGIASPPSRLVTDRAAAVAAARELGHPVVLKGQSPDVAHKTELGLVRVGLADAEAVGEAFDDLMQRLDTGVLVEQMAPEGVDVIVGTSGSAFGPVLMFGLGGVHAELLGDVVFRLAPVTLDEAYAMIDGIRAAPALNGYRGAAALDRVALAEAIVAVGAFAAAHAGAVDTVEVNPLRVLEAGHGVVALDALIR